MAETFEGWDVGAEGDIFDSFDAEQDKEAGIETETPPAEEEPKVDEKAGGKETKKEVEPEVDPFEEIDVEEGVDPEESKKPVEDKGEEGDDKSPPGILKTLHEKGYIEMGEDEEISEEDLDTVLEDKMEEAFDNRFKELFENFPPEVRALNEFVLKGGDPNEFFRTAAKTPVAIGDLDLEDESSQVKVAKQALMDEGHDEEFIEAQIDFLKDSKKLQAYASKKQESYKTRESEEKESLLKRQQEKAQKEKETLRNMKKSITDVAAKNDFDHISLSRKEVKEIPSYITDRTVKTEGGGTISEFQKDLLSTLNDPGKVTILAKLIKNGFDFSDIKKKAVTDQTKKIKKDLQRAKSSQKMAGGNAASSRSSLADFF